MTTAMITNVLIGIVIALIGFLGKELVKRLDRFEKIVQGILMSDVAVSKDLEKLKEDVKDHEDRISKLEK
jgi:cell division protein FtsB